MDVPPSSAELSYPELLQATTSLRNDLEKAILKIKTLQSDNRNLTEQSKKLELSLYDSQNNYNAAKKNYLVTLNKKINQEEQFEGFIQKVKQQLKEKSKEFETLLDKFAPSDVDFVRIKVQEELELKYFDKLQQLESEAEYYRNQFNFAKRETEKIKIEYHLFTTNHKTDVYHISNEYDTVIQDLKDEIQKYKAIQHFSDSDESLRQMKLQITELVTVESNLQNELKKCRQERDAAILERDSVVSNIEEMKNEYQTKLMISDSSKLKIELSNKTLQSERELKDQALVKLKRDFEQALSEKSEIEHQQRQSEAMYKDKLNYVSNTYTESIETLQKDNQTLQNEINRLSEIIFSHESYVKRSQKLASDMQQDTEKMESNLRKSFLTEYQKLLTYNDELEASISNKDNEIRLLKRHLSKLSQKVSIEIEIMKNDIQKLQREKMSLQDKISKSSTMNYTLQQQ